MAFINGKKSLQVVKTQGVAVDVEANPAGTATDTLEKIKIDDTIYAVEGGASQVDDELSYTSILPVQNKVITAALDDKANVDGYYETFGYARESGVASNLKNRDNAYVGAEYTKRTAGGTNDIGTGTALIKRLKGNSIVFNQLVQNGNFESDSGWNLPASTTIEDNKAKFSLSQGNVLYGVSRTQTFTDGHKVLQLFNLKTDNPSNINLLRFRYPYVANLTVVNNTNFNTYGVIGTASDTTALLGFQIQLSLSTTTNCEVEKYICIDLTQMFGAGNEPSTVAEFKALFPANYYAYNAGTIINFNGTGIKTIGFNQYNNATGTAALLGGNQYQISGTYTSVSYEDLNGNAETLTIANDGTFTPTNTGTLTVVGGNATDTCVHLTWSGYRNGEFEAYKENNLTFDISSIKDGNDAALFPNGLCSAGTAYDEVRPTGATKRLKYVNLSTLNWSAGNYGNNQGWYTDSLTDIKTVSYGVAFNGISNNYISVGSMGVNLVVGTMLVAYGTQRLWVGRVDGDTTNPPTGYLAYELADPIDVVFDTPLNLGYAVDDFGTEQMLPYEPTTTPTTSPINYDVLYAFNAIDTLRNLPKNYISKASFDNFTAALIGAMATIGYTMTVTPTYDSANNEYDFNVTLAATQQGE